VFYLGVTALAQCTAGSKQWNGDERHRAKRPLFNPLHHVVAGKTTVFLMPYTLHYNLRHCNLQSIHPYVAHL